MSGTHDEFRSLCVIYGGRGEKQTEQQGQAFESGDVFHRGNGKLVKSSALLER